MFKAIPQNAKIISELTKFISENSFEACISYVSLNLVAKRDVRNDYRYLLATAIDRVEQNLGCVFGCVRGVGIKRLHPDETGQAVGSTSILSIRRKAKKGNKRIIRVNTNEMGADGRQNAALKAAHLNLIEGLADNRRTKQLVNPATSDPYAGKKATGL